jgi:hypothetical protein
VQLSWEDPAFKVILEPVENIVPPEAVTVDDPQFIVPVPKNPETVSALLFVFRMEEPVKLILPAEKSLPKLNVPVLNCTGFPGGVTLLVVMVFVPDPLNAKAYPAPENAIVPAVQDTFPVTDIDVMVPVTNVTTPTETVQLAQARVPFIVTE